MIKNIFFDFDGVIADSVNVKTEAFYKLYLPYGKDIAVKVREHHIANGGVSRFEKIRYYHNNFLTREIEEKEIQEYAAKFSKLALEGVIKSPLVPGVLEFLRKYSETLNCWVITATPSNEIEIILQRRDLSKYFVNHFGSPENKKYWVNHILTDHKLNKEECLFIGDALSDYEAALSFEIKFVLRVTEQSQKLFENRNNILLRIDNFVNFEAEMKKMGLLVQPFV